LLNGQAPPDHTTISRFRKHFLPQAIDHLFYQLVHVLHDCGEIAFENAFIDGTKIEANANRYSFVWKKAVLKNEAAMFEKIDKLSGSMNQEYDVTFSVAKDSLLDYLAVILRLLEEQRLALGIKFVSAKEKHKPQLHRYVEQLRAFYERQETYNIHN